MRKLFSFLFSAMLCLFIVTPSWCVDEVSIGLLYPLTGKMAPAGTDLVKGIELATEIVNNAFPDLDLPLAGTAGLPNLGGAKLKLFVEDHEASPEKAMSGAERLINERKVSALIGAHLSSCTATASQVAERYKVPMINAASSSPTLTERGFKWFFRPSPHDETFVESYFLFLNDVQKKTGKPIKRIALMCEDTLFGSDVVRLTHKFAEKHGYEIVLEILTTPGTNELTTEVQKIKAAKPDVLMTATYVSDQILYMRTAKEMDLNIDGLLMTTGWVDNSIILPTLKEDGNHVICRDVWALDLAAKKPLISKVNEMYKERHGVNMNGNIARAFQAAYVLYIAINNAGSAEPAAIRDALASIDLDEKDLIVPWKRVKFNEQGQNEYGSSIIVQTLDNSFYTVWPFEYAAKELVWPRPNWNELKK